MRKRMERGKKSVRSKARKHSPGRQDLGSSELQEMESTKPTERENALRILCAHKALVSLSESNAEKFRNVVDALERELALTSCADGADPVE